MVAIGFISSCSSVNKGYSKSEHTIDSSYSNRSDSFRVITDRSTIETKVENPYKSRTIEFIPAADSLPEFGISKIEKGSTVKITFEDGSRRVETTTKADKKDSSSKSEVKSGEVKSKETQVQKYKKKIGFNFGGIIVSVVALAGILVYLKFVKR